MTHTPRSRRNPGLPLVPLLLGLGGCDRRLGVLDGYDLGEAQAAAFGSNAASRTMVVLSDLPGLCDDLQHSDPPEVSDWWVLSIWTGSSAGVEGEYPAHAYAAVTRDGELREYDSLDAFLDIRDLEEGSLTGRVDASFSGGDALGARVRAESCDALYFQGMELP